MILVWQASDGHLWPLWFWTTRYDEGGKRDGRTMEDHLRAAGGAPKDSASREDGYWKEISYL